MFAYCYNNPVNCVDSTGQYAVYTIVTYCGYTYTNVPMFYFGYYGQIKDYWQDGEINAHTQTITYSVPLYNQGNTNLCWAYCQTMIESFDNGKTYSQTEADKRAKELAIKCNGAHNWDAGNWPDGVDPSNKTYANDIESIYNLLFSNGPVYAYYVDSSNTTAHLVVITGVSVDSNKVFTNNPWGISGTQSFSDFQQGVARNRFQSNQGLMFNCIYL